jgi:uncharacterized protein YndB with AHSA1/START domain
MKLVAWIFGGLVGLWLLLLLVGFVLPGHFKVERSTVISAQPAAVFPRVADLKAWRQWGVWFSRDPAMQVAYSPATTEVGAWSQWKSKSQGDGKMTITAVRPGEYFEYRMEFADMGMVSRGTMELAAGPGATTRVTMGMEGDLGRSPINRWFGLFMDRLVGPDFEAGLANLKRISEASAK